MTRIALAVALLAVAGVRADVASGPKAGDKVAALPVYAVTGEPKDKDVDYAAERKEKPTVYVFVRADQWSRPMFRFMKTVGEALPDLSDDARIVAVWLTEKPDQSKEYLPKIEQYFKATALTVFAGELSGPKDWGINTDAHATAVVVNNGKVVASFGYQSLNETDADGVRDALKKALGK